MSTQASPEALDATTTDTPAEPDSGGGKEVAGKSPLRIALGRLLRDPLAVICAVVVLLFILIALFAPLLTRAFGVSIEPVLASERVYISPTAGDFVGFPKTGPPLYGYDPNHPFGVAPNTGEDNLAYWIYGARTSLTIALVSTVIASLIGVVIGLVAGFAGGLVDKVLSFVTDFFLTVPFLLAALTLAPIINERFVHRVDYPGFWDYPMIQKFSLVLVLGLFGWMPLARLVRGEVLSLREREFIQAARVLGMPTRRILVRELLPNLVAPIVISISLMLPAFVALEAGLAYLGIGVTEGASWGQTILKATVHWDDYPLYLLEPMLGIVLLVVALNLLGDAIRDALDPKTRR